MGADHTMRGSRWHITWAVVAGIAALSVGAQLTTAGSGAKVPGARLTEPEQPTADIPESPTVPDLDERPAAAAVSVDPATGALSVTLMGDTPSLAWAPDGRRIAFAQDWYYLWAAPEVHGIYWLDVVDGAVSAADTVGGYHPGWLDSDTVVYSRRESRDDGLEVGVYTLSTTGEGGPTPVHTPVDGALVWPSSSQEFVYTSYSYDFMRYRIDTGTAESLDYYGYYYEPPPGRVLDQCLQNVGNVRAWATTEDGIFLAVGAEAPVQLSADPLLVSDWRPPLQPCLSPDGSRVAYATTADGVGWMLHVAPVPPAETR